MAKSYSYNELVQAKQNYQAWIWEETEKIIRMQQEGKPLKKQQKHIDHKAELEASLQAVLKMLEPYEQEYYRQTKLNPTMPAGWNPGHNNSGGGRPGEGKKAVGTALMIIGILISVGSFLSGAGIGASLFGFFINMIGIALIVSGNREQGKDTTVFGGGFISTGG